MILKRNTFHFVLLASLLTGASSSASEICEWTADKSMELYDLKVESGLPESALKRFAGAFVDAERDEGFFKRSWHKGVLEGFVEVMFDPEMAILVDGTLNRREVEKIFFEGCIEAMN